VKFLLRWLVNALALWIAAEVVPGIAVAGPGNLLLAALVIGLINAFIRPILRILTIPITILTLGLFLLVLNALLFWLAAALVPGFAVSGFVAAFLGALILAVVSFALSFLVK
jgi:putative membrane protein